MSGLKGERILVSLGFSSKPVTSPLRATSTTPKAGDLVRGDGEGGEGDVGAGVAVLLQHEGVVHLVDVVAGEDDDVLGLLGADGVDVLVDGVGGALVPGLGDALHGREDLDELAEFVGDDGAPALADVAVERERLVLGEDVDVAQVGVDAVGEGDVDDAVLAGEGDGRLGAIAGQGEEPFAGTTGKQNAKRISHITHHSNSGTASGEKSNHVSQMHKTTSVQQRNASLPRSLDISNV